MTKEFAQRTGRLALGADAATGSGAAGSAAACRSLALQLLSWTLFEVPLPLIAVACCARTTAAGAAGACWGTAGACCWGTVGAHPSASGLLVWGGSPLAVVPIELDSPISSSFAVDVLNPSLNDGTLAPGCCSGVRLLWACLGTTGAGLAKGAGLAANAFAPWLLALFAVGDVMIGYMSDAASSISCHCERMLWLVLEVFVCGKLSSCFEWLVVELPLLGALLYNTCASRPL